MSPRFVRDRTSSGCNAVSDMDIAAEAVRISQGYEDQLNRAYQVPRPSSAPVWKTGEIQGAAVVAGNSKPG